MSAATSAAPPRLALDGFHPAVIGFWAVLVATLFNVVLCFASTHHLMRSGTTQVVAIEMAVLLTAILSVRNLVGAASVQMAGVAVVTLIVLKLFNGDVDLKILHDLAIMLVFFVLGRVCPEWLANRLVAILLVVVIGFGLMELLLPRVFEQNFDIWSYYLDKGVLSEKTVNYTHTKSFVSGERAADVGRTLLPFLGAHRVSSVFLEPVSFGNFAIILLAWLLSVPTRSVVTRGMLAVAVAFCVVLPDSRFAAACCIIMLLFRLTPLHRSSAVVFCMPVVAVIGLLIAGGVGHQVDVVPSLQRDDFSGRLLFSGQLLDFWGWRQWLGLKGSPVYTADTGYAYVIVNLGLPLALWLWFAFAMVPIATQQGRTMRGMMAIYLTASLCIGASVFSIKTGALCWFLYGVACQSKVLLQAAGRFGLVPAGGRVFARQNAG